MSQLGVTRGRCSRAQLPHGWIRSNALRNNLIHPNEYVRGSTLRFLTKLREPGLLESLVPSIKACLTHRHPYVRKNGKFFDRTQRWRLLGSTPARTRSRSSSSRLVAAIAGLRVLALAATPRAAVICFCAGDRRKHAP